MTILVENATKKRPKSWCGQKHGGFIFHVWRFIFDSDEVQRVLSTPPKPFCYMLSSQFSSAKWNFMKCRFLLLFLTIFLTDLWFSYFSTDFVLFFSFMFINSWYLEILLWKQVVPYTYVGYFLLIDWSCKCIVIQKVLIWFKVVRIIRREKFQAKVKTSFYLNFHQKRMTLLAPNQCLYHSLHI